MKKLVFIILLTFFSRIGLTEETGTEEKVIEIHNKSDQLLIDQFINENIENSEEFNIIDPEVSKINAEIIEETNSVDIAIVEDLESKTENIDSIILDPDEELLLEEKVFDFSKMWSQINKDDLIFLLANIDNLKSSVLKNELLKILNISNLIPNNFNQADYDKLIIDSVLNLGDRKKSYEMIKSLENLDNKIYANFYKELELNYLLSTSYSESEACEFRDEIKDENDSNFFLKVDIFCLLVQEKFDEANLLYSLLDESIEDGDKYFEYLFNNFQESEIKKVKNNISISPTNVFLYSAMHRIGNIPFTNNFVSIDSINLSMPIILSRATNIDLRLRAAHLAFFNNILSIDSLAALYQTVDFSFDELNEPDKDMSIFDNKTEIGMAYFYQLINRQILSYDRLKAIFNFWDFAEKNNLELIAYQLSLKSLNTIEASNEFSLYGARIAKAYTYSDNFLMAERWILFSESFLKDEQDLYELNSSKLLFNLFNNDPTENIANILYENLQYMNKNLIDKSNPDYLIKNEILYIIFSILNKNNLNPFQIEKKINENRPMTSVYSINQIRNSVEINNQAKLLLSISASINGKKWNEIHPEHFRLILQGLSKYKQGEILNNILLEILEQSKII